MDFSEVLPVILVVIFWALAFLFAFWFTRRSLRPPTETEQEYAHENAARQEAPVH